MKREERIAKYEEILDRAEETAQQLEAALDAYRKIQQDLAKLEKYYTGPQWKKDYEADEKGRLPAGLKRGVLSEDGIYNLLERYRELKEQFSSDD